MYTNGLKDRYGSPLLSLDVGDERYVMMNQIEFSHAKIEEKIESFGKHVEKNRDDIIDLKNKNYNTNVVLNAHRKNEEEHFTEGEKEKFDNLFVRLDGVEEFTKETIPQSETTGDNGGEAFRMSALMLPVGQVIDEIIVPTKNTPTSSFYLGVYKILSTESNDSTNKTLVAISDEAITWTNGGEAIWGFDDTPFEIPVGFDLEIHIATTKEDLTATGTNYRANGDNELKCRYKNNATGYGACRYQTGWYGNRAIRAILKRKGIQGHIGDNTHLTEEQRTALDEVISDTFVTKEEFDSLVEQTKQKHQYYDTWTNLKDGDINDKADAYSFQLDKADFVTGRIDRIEIPYVKGNNSNGHLCVQFFDSSNSVVATHYSLNKQKQDKTGNNDVGLCEYEFATFETPSDYSFVRFSMVENNSVVPTGNSGITFRIRPIKRNNSFTWNTNTNTRINNTGTRWTILLSVLTRKTGKNIGITIRQYDWTPDVFSPINVTLSTAGNVFVAPTNGWVVSNSAQTTSGANSLTLNGVEIAKSSGTAQADVQILIRKGEFVTATTAYNLVFYPCKSEQFDYRIEGGHTPYDIWKGAVVYDELGQPSVKDLYIPDASAWKTEVGSAVTGKIATISGEEALDSNGNVLFNIQSRYIENGSGMFVQSTITSFTSTLDVLNNGTQMFGYSGLTQWNVNLPNLVTGDCMFMGCGSLTSFTADLHSLSSGWYFLANCTNLTDVSFVGGLDALTNGTYMFKGCSLNYTSLNNILNALPARNGNVIEITVADSVKDDMLNDTQWAGISVPPHHSGAYYEFTHKGWKVRLTSHGGFDVIAEQPSGSPFDVSEENGYIPDASSWNTNVYNANNLNIVSVVDGVAYDGLV